MNPFPDVGDIAPDISLPSTDGHFNLYERLTDGAVLLVFYPKDKTLICTKQLCNYRDNVAMFDELRVQIVGINQDDLDSHQTFAMTHKFGFPLVSDTERVASAAYGVLLDLFKLKRTLVLVGEDGHIWWRHSQLRIFHRDAADLREVIASLSLDT